MDPASTGKEPRISCMNAMHVVNYFIRKRNVPADIVLAGLEHNLEYLRDNGNWLSNEETLRLFSNCQKSIPGFTHKDWKAVGQEVYGKGAPGFFGAIFKIMPVDAIFKGVPNYIKNVVKWCGYEIISDKKGEILYKCAANDRVNRDRYSTGGECNYHLGVITILPKLKDDYDFVCTAEHEICSMPLGLLAENSLGLKPVEYNYGDNGFYVKGELVAQWVKLKPLAENKKFMGREYEICGRQAVDALVIIKDIALDGADVFIKDEIYEAPYCVFRVTYKKRFFLGERMSKKQMIVFLEKHLLMSEEKFRQTVEAKKALEKSLEEVNKRNDIIKIYIRDSVMREVNSGVNPLEFSPKKRNAAIMFSDIREFTAITEKMEPIELTRFLNTYFYVMSQPISDNHGEIDKFIGDAIMAVFSEPAHAVKAAVEMNRLMSSENEWLLADVRSKIRMGVGINFDEVVEGNIGTTDTKMDRTIIGDGVNLASRLESLTKFYDTAIIISDTVREELDESFDLRYLDLITVKGKIRPVEIYEVLNGQAAGIVAFKKETVKEYKYGVTLYRAGNFAKSLKVFMELNAKLDSYRKSDPACHDPIIDIYITRLVDMLKVADNRHFMENWDGVFRHGDK